MASLRSRSKSKDSPLELCTKATLLGNKISVRMLEFLSTVKQHPHGFTTLAHDFLEICRILWSIEAGLAECSRTHQHFPDEMLCELEKKFRTTYSDFQLLDQMLFKLLEYERRGTVGRIQRGWRRMFADNDIEKMRVSLARTGEALRMSALVFQWTLGSAKIDQSVGIGYTGLAAALERMGIGGNTNNLQMKNKSVDHLPVRDVNEGMPALPDLPPLPSLPAPSAHERDPSIAGSSTHSAHRYGLHDQPVHKPMLPEMHRRTSMSTGTGHTTHTTRSLPRERVTSPQGSFDRAIGLGESARVSGTTNTSGMETLVGDMDQHDQMSINKVVRLKPDPLTMPRWTPRKSGGTSAPSLRAALISAVQEKNHRLAEQLLDQGASPSTGPGVHVLKEAILNHDIENVRRLLLFGADPNEPDRDGITPLFAAVEALFLEGATLLLKYGADPNLAAGPEGESPLAMSIVDNNINFVHTLLTYGGDANHMTSKGSTILIRAMNKNTPRQLIKLLLNYGADPNAKSRDGKTPLFEAIGASRADIVTLLMDHGADPNLPGPKHMLWPSASQPQCLSVLLSRGAQWKKCPGIIELATSINNIDSVRILLEAGVDPNCKKDGVYTPLCTSIRDNRTEIFHMLLAHGADPNLMASEYPTWKCVTHFRTNMLPALVTAGGSLTNPSGIIETAVRVNNTDALVYLLDQGVNPNDKSPEGYTPLTTAIQESRLEAVDLLLARGADPNVRGKDWPVCLAVRQPVLLKRLLPLIASPRAYRGVIEMAVVANQLESIKLLLQSGVSVEDKNGGVFSPLTTAIREDRIEIVRFLLETGKADPNAPGEHLPLVKAVRRCRDISETQIIEMLLDRGADINRTYRGWNAVMQTIENGDIDMLRLLVERGGGVDLDVQDDAGRSVIDIASSRGWDEAVTLLRSAAATDRR